MNFGNKNEKISGKRKRIKLECLECGKTFDNDYKQKHEKNIHNGKKVGTKHFGAPKNPFEASKSNSKLIQNTQRPLEKSCFTNINLNHLPPKPPESLDIPFLDVTHETPTTSTAIDVNIECFEECISTDQLSDDIPKNNREFDESSWLLCAGHIEDIVSNLVECKELLKKLKSDSTPNPITFLLESQHIISNLNSKSELFLRTSKKISQHVFNSFDDQLNQHSNQLIEHDPGKRGPVLTSSQRQYLIAMGPHQPKLIKYPINNNIDKVKQQSFNSSWYNEYPKLEYSLATDAAYCFVCSLFPKTAGKMFSNTAWVDEGVRTWHKMKSRGKSKLGKLEQNFTSLSHKASLGDNCSFMKNTNHIDVIMNRAKRNELITLEHEKEFNRQVIVILFDIVRTLARQGLAFRDDGDESGEMKHILPWANKICKLALTAPISVATNERSFSKLRPIKNNLRSSIGDDRLDSLMILSLEKYMVDQLDMNKIATLWATLKNRRINI